MWKPDGCGHVFEGIIKIVVIDLSLVLLFLIDAKTRGITVAINDKA
eukprot:CAMPEP_0197835990 /NCGR_PEP_ID=MMETSP1437-20131217/27622_1 /TAXON_ID=49252 ORGANISM="Eucampia antarctica, Strain CCMP1452" /NCGR_SAMPLE_ID=MMETSP1437 /ASSEMBLY_ACC=CAM_ASM_001096 /LENGTH=45 /DNA_ID= /DNA_START= /DNA_END= /DNA_ORIENTATION=